MNAYSKKDSIDIKKSAFQAFVDHGIIPQNSAFDKHVITTENLWKLFTKSTSKLENQSRLQEQEMQTVQKYVQQIKDLSDERDRLTDEFEIQNTNLKEQLDYVKNEISQETDEIHTMLKQEGLVDIVSKTASEQVAHLLVMRAASMEEAGEDKNNLEKYATQLQAMKEKFGEMEKTSKELNQTRKQIKQLKITLRNLKYEKQAVEKRVQIFKHKKILY